MALVNCPECGKKISSKADKCIYCGYPLQESINTDDGNAIRHGENQQICPSCGCSFDGNKCPNCGCYLVSDNDENEKSGINQLVKLGNVKKVEKQKKKKDSILSIVSCVLVGVSGIIPLPVIVSFSLILAGIIVALIDLCKNNKSERHIGAWFALIFGLMAIFVVFL